jgi:hypothetical protein
MPDVWGQAVVHALSTAGNFLPCIRDGLPRQRAGRSGASPGPFRGYVRRHLPAERRLLGGGQPQDPLDAATSRQVAPSPGSEPTFHRCTAVVGKLGAKAGGITPLGCSACQEVASALATSATVRIGSNCEVTADSRHVRLEANSGNPGVLLDGARNARGCYWLFTASSLLARSATQRAYLGWLPLARRQ